MDNTIVWATGLIASGSTFRRICMIGRGRVAKSLIHILARRQIPLFGHVLQKNVGIWHTDVCRAIACCLFGLGPGVVVRSPSLTSSKHPLSFGSNVEG